MDRNSVIGFSLLAAMLIAYFTYNNYSQGQFEQKRQADSVKLARLHPVAPIDSTRFKAAASLADTLKDSLLAAMPPAFRHTEQKVSLENKDVAITFSTLGAHPVAALLKNYKTYEEKPLYLFNGPENTLSAIVPNGQSMIATGDLSFTAQQQGPQKIDFVADLGNGKRVDFIYTLPTEGYMMSCDVRLTGIAANSLPLRWNTKSLHTERDITSERQNSQVHYSDLNKKHDYWTVSTDGIHKTPNDGAAVRWLGFRMHYFSTALIADGGFTKADVTASAKADSQVVAQSNITMELPMKADGTGSMRWFIGPNHYKTLQNYNIGLDELVPLGSGVFFFVKYINKWMIIPIFDILAGFITNYGVIIMLLTLFIKLILSFFTYKSYLSSAKMRVLKPELDELRAKIGDDQQKMGVEQMKLYRSAGVSPLGGCLPTLFMMPFLVAMYYFFPAAIDFRQKSFLWAHDLSTYDSIARLPFSFFDHISLFTLLMTASSLFLALYNRNMTPQDPNNPMMKYMPFIFPFVLLGVFNKMAAALTFYYFFSNMISILQQFVIQKLFINEEKIHAQLKENRNKPATPSKWQQKLEEMQKANAGRVQGGPAKK